MWVTKREGEEMEGKFERENKKRDKERVRENGRGNKGERQRTGEKLIPYYFHGYISKSDNEHHAAAY